MGLKVAVVGGGSTYTPELVEGLATRSERLPVDELVLFDLDPERIRAVETGACPHTAIRDDISANLDAVEQLDERRHPAGVGADDRRAARPGPRL